MLAEKLKNKKKLDKKKGITKIEKKKGEKWKK